jgi:hypothetical protein
MADPVNPQGPFESNTEDTKNFQTRYTKEYPERIPLDPADYFQVEGFNAETGEDGFYWTTTKAILQAAKVVIWKRNYVPGEYVDRNTMVVDGDYVMISNVDTTARAAPVLVGSPTWLLDSLDPGWVTSNQMGRTVVTGNQFSINLPVSLTSARVYVPVVGAAIWYRSVMVTNVGLPDELITYGDWFLPTVVGWVLVDFAARFIEPGVFFSVGVESENRDTVITDLVQYSFSSSNSAVVPLTGEMHRDINSSQLFIHKTPAAGTLTIPPLPGSAILFGGNQWNLSTVTDQGTYWECVFSGAGDPPTGIGDFTFKTASSVVAQYYRENPGYWSTHLPVPPNQVVGFIILDGVRTDSTTAYGVDLLYQSVETSNDWDLLFRR